MIGLYIGRFQPLHNGHMSVINRILSESSKLVIGLGSSSEAPSVINPFSLDERIRMLELSVNGNYEIIPLVDTSTDDEWMNNVNNKIPKFDFLYTGSPIMEKLFRDYQHNVRKVAFASTGDDENRSISATHIRDLMYISYPEWRNLVPEGTAKVIDEIRGEERVKSLYKAALGYNKHI